MTEAFGSGTSRCSEPIVHCTIGPHWPIGVRCWASLGEWEKARDQFTEAINRGANGWAVPYSRARVNVEMGRFPRCDSRISIGRLHLTHKTVRRDSGGSTSSAGLVDCPRQATTISERVNWSAWPRVNAGAQIWIRRIGHL